MHAHTNCRLSNTFTTTHTHSKLSAFSWTQHKHTHTNCWPQTNSQHLHGRKHTHTSTCFQFTFLIKQILETYILPLTAFEKNLHYSIRIQTFLFKFILSIYFLMFGPELIPLINLYSTPMTRQECPLQSTSSTPQRGQSSHNLCHPCPESSLV